MSNSALEQRPLQIQEFRGYQPVVDGIKRDVPVEFVANNLALQNPQARQLHVYPGLGEERRTATHTMQVLDSVGMPAIAIILPFHHLEPTYANIERIPREVPIHFAKERNLETGQEEAEVKDLFGNSQGGGAVLMAAQESPEQFGSLAINGPIGLNPEAFGDDSTSDWAKRFRFIWRLGIRNALLGDQQPIHIIGKPRRDPGNSSGKTEVWRRVISDFRDDRLWPKLDAALALSLEENVKSLRIDHPLRIFLGERDPLFRLAELLATLGKVGCEDLVEVVPGASHSLLMGNAGTRRVIDIAKWVQKSREASYPEAA